MSFGLTKEALIMGLKTVTRRKWKQAWVKEGDLVQAWSKGPHRGGRKLGIIKILRVTDEIFGDSNIDENEAAREGFAGEEGLVKALSLAGVKIGDPIFRIAFEPVGEIR